ncbi:site-specific integrase [Rhizobium ruizarguesonis]
MTFAGELELDFTGPDFRWHGEEMAGVPMLVWVDGRVFEPTLCYFCYSCEIDRVAVSSMASEAYSLREWFSFLVSRGISWDCPSDRLLSDFRQNQQPLVKARHISSNQVEKKIQRIYEFYRLLPSATRYFAPFARVMGDPGQSGFPLTSKMRIDRKGRIYHVWLRAKRHRKRRVRRPIPDAKEVKAVENLLRSGEEEINLTEERWDRRRSLLKRERDWLMVRCIVGAGLRISEVTNLSVAMIAAALRAEGILRDFSTGLNDGELLADAAYDTAAQDLILARLESFRASGRQYLDVTMVRKPEKTCSVPFEVELVRQLLVVGIWSVRKAQLDKLTEHPEDPVEETDYVFLSFKAINSPLNSGSLGDLIKQAFNALGIRGSAHRLRAYYATTLALKLWSEFIALNGFHFDQVVVNMTLDRLADALGHEQPTTSIRYYVDMAIERHFGGRNRARRPFLSKIWRSIMADTLSKENLKLVADAIDRLKGPTGEDFAAHLRYLCDDPDFQPPEPEKASARPKRTKPRLAFSSDREV